MICKYMIVSALFYHTEAFMSTGFPKKITFRTDFPMKVS